jgi:hypothetical protein
MARTSDVELRSQAASPREAPRMGRRAPPFMRWDQRGKPELQLSLEQADGTTLRVMMGTADWDEAMRRARPITERAVLEGRLLANSRAARIYGVFDVPDFWADLARAGGMPQAQYEVEREAIARRWNFPVWIVDRLAKREARSLSLAGYRARRYRLRKRGQQTMMGSSWHYRRGGKKYFFRNGNMMCVRMYIAGRVYQWSLQTRSNDQAARIAGRIGVARERVRRAATKLIDCKPGSSATDSALTDCAKACRRLSEAIRRAGGPIELVNLVLQPPPLPADVMMPSKRQPADLAMNLAPKETVSPRLSPTLPVLSKTKMKKAAREECERLLKQRYNEYVDNPDPDKERPLKDEIRSEMLEIQNLTPNAFDECWQKLGLEKWKVGGAPPLKKSPEKTLEKSPEKTPEKKRI